MTGRKREPRAPPAEPSVSSKVFSKAFLEGLEASGVRTRAIRAAGLGFGPPFTPPIVKQLLIANAAVFVAQNPTHW